MTPWGISIVFKRSAMTDRPGVDIERRDSEVTR